MDWALKVFCKNAFLYPSSNIGYFLLLSLQFFHRYFKNMVYRTSYIILICLISHASSHYPLLYTATDNVITFCWSTVFRIHVKLHLSSVNVLYLGYSINSSNYELCSSVHKFSFCKIAFILLEAVQCRSLFSSIFPLIFSSVDFNL